MFICGLYLCKYILSCCVYAGSFMEFQCFEVKPEDDKPSIGMSTDSHGLVVTLQTHVQFPLSKM